MLGKQILILVNLAIPFSTSTAEVGISIPKDELVEAIIQVESRGNDSAYNPKEDAVGCMQIRPIMVREVNRLIGKDSFNLDDRWDRDKSIGMFYVIKAHTKNPTDEKLARNWNGGWSGYKKRSTLKYWEKVKREL